MSVRVTTAVHYPVPLPFMEAYSYLNHSFNDFPEIFYLCLLVSLINQLGDLFISIFKRQAKVKDTGSILPGHGGLLDRIDGMIFAIPFAYILFLFS